MVRIISSFLRPFLFCAIIAAISTTTLQAEWKTITTGDDGFDLRGVSFVNETVGFIAGWLQTFDHIDLWGVGRTTDGGENFLWQSGVLLELTGIRFHDMDNGFMIGRDPECNCPIVVYTTTGGANWPNTSFAQIHGAFVSLDFADPLHGVFAGGDPVTSQGLVVRTTDGGMNFSTILQREGMYISHIDQVDQKRLYITAGASAGSENAIWKTTNADAEPDAVEWNLVYTFPELGSIKGIDFIDDQNGFLLFASFENPGALAEIYKTTNGGVNWEPVYRSADFVLTALDFLDADHGFAVGSNGAIVQTNDGGKNWSDTVTGITPLLMAVDYVSSTVAYAVGFGGIILKYQAEVSDVKDADEGVGGQKGKYIEVLSDRGKGRVLLAKKGAAYPSDSHLFIYDLLGNVVVEKNAKDASSECEINGLRKGLYILSVISGRTVLQQERFLVW